MEDEEWRKKNVVVCGQGKETDINGGRRMLWTNWYLNYFGFPSKKHIFFKFLTYHWVKNEEQKQPVILLLATG